ncbi:hypothetical protein HBNXHr_2808 [Halorhabdus sp. BNX81]|nr:hypothetical protein HBNXHr_2808 [Halorhabdus sp. BNX81]
MHELNHALSIGWGDDEPIPIPVIGGFIGSDADETPEEIWDLYRRSLMSAISEEKFGQPMNGEYSIFSIQELLTIHEPE